MTKKFAEHSGLDLTKVNNEILEMWKTSSFIHLSKISLFVSISLKQTKRF